MVSIVVDDLRREFSVPAGIEVAVDDIDLESEDGEFVSLVGPSGCGKTTTLRCIAGLDTPTSGSIWFGDREVTHVPANKREVAMMFQNIALYPHMTIRDNIVYPLKVRHVSKDEQDEQAKEVSKLMQISDLLEKYPGELSGGQRQRAALARTIIQDPAVFLMDEPLSDLDAKLKAEIRQEIQRIHQRIGKTTVYVTHDQEEAMTMSDRIAVMNDGQIMQLGEPDELYMRPVNKFVAAFIGNPSMNFLDANVDFVDSETLTVSFEDNENTFDIEGTTIDADTVVLGFRPENVSFNEIVGDRLCISAEITLIEYIGDRLLVTLEGSDGQIQATTNPDRELKEGSVVPVFVDQNHVHIFDTETGETLRNGTRKQSLVADGA